MDLERKKEISIIKLTTAIFLPFLLFSLLILLWVLIVNISYGGC